MIRIQTLLLALTVASMGGCLPEDTSNPSSNDPDASDSVDSDDMGEDDASASADLPEGDASATDTSPYDDSRDDDTSDDNDGGVVPDLTDDVADVSAPDGDADTVDTSDVDWPDCAPNGASVIAAIFYDDRFENRADTAFVNINSGSNPEASLGCDATVTLIVDGEETVFEETRQGQYEAGYSAIQPGLPSLTLYAGLVHVLEIDLDSDGTVDITGEVTMSDINNFDVDESVPGEVTFSWDDDGIVAATTYSVQASNETDFTFADYFATGFVEADTFLKLGGDSEWRYFQYGGTVHARIQSDTTGTLSVAGRFNAWQWPTEPILSF